MLCIGGTCEDGDDALMVLKNGSSITVYDGYMGPVQFGWDTSDDDFTATNEEVSSELKKVIVTRDLETPDEHDYVIPVNTEWTLGW